MKFFENRGHTMIPSASLVPNERDTSVLFTTAGMQPLIPYLLGESHPQGKRIVNIQKCVRTQDIEEVGDKTHDTFFEMMGNWSLGDYFKEEAIAWSYELLTNKVSGFGLDPNRLYITVFGGNTDAPRDSESFEIWKKVGIPENRIYFMTFDGKKEPNWWSAGENGPCGPDTEMFYDITPEGLGDLTKEEYIEADQNQKVVEIWNDVFMEYLKKDGKVVGQLSQKNVDTGSGLERITMVLQSKDNIFDTDLFSEIMVIAKNLSSVVTNQRIIADHLRTAIFIISDGVFPSNTDRGYILRRLIRRSMIKTDAKIIDQSVVSAIVSVVAENYYDTYPEIHKNHEKIVTIINEEVQKFEKVLKSGMREFEKLVNSKMGVGAIISPEEFFSFSSSYGLPADVLEELSSEKGIIFDRDTFDLEKKKHQDLSRASAEQKFKRE